jgi:homogentisate phytyltransferase/homogentisate geranylgeranyltransferase
MRIEEMKAKIETLIRSVEDNEIGLLAFLLLLTSIIFTRSFMEYNFAYPGDFISLQTLHHWTTGYLSAFLSSILLISYLSKERVEKVSKVVLLGYSVIILPPIIDHFTSNYVHYNYVFDSQLPLSAPNWNMLMRAYFTFYTDIQNVMLGQKIEIILLIIVASLYVFLKTRSVIRTSLSAIGIYTLTFFYLTFPNYFSFGSFPATFDSTHGAYSWLYYVSIFAVLISVQSVIWLFLYNKKAFARIIRNLLRERSLHYLAMVWFGAYLAGTDFYTTLLASLCVLFMWQSAIATNDIYDVDGDTVSKKSNPLVNGTSAKTEISGIAIFSALMSLLLATFLSYAAILIVTFYLVISSIYSIPPIRIKKYPIISVFATATGAVLTFALGFFSTPTEKAFPVTLAYAMLICFTLAFNTKDLKDYEGDKKNRVWTIPVIFGLKRGRIIIAFLDLLAYLVVPLIIGRYNVIIPAAVFGVTTFLVVLRKESKEWQIFLLYFLFLATLLIIK